MIEIWWIYYKSQLHSKEVVWLDVEGRKKIPPLCELKLECQLPKRGIFFFFSKRVDSLLKIGRLTNHSRFWIPVLTGKQGRNRKGMGCEPALPLAPNSGGVSKVSQCRSLLQDGIQPPSCLRLQIFFSCLTLSPPEAGQPYAKRKESAFITLLSCIVLRAIIPCNHHVVVITMWSQNYYPPLQMRKLKLDRADLSWSYLVSMRALPGLLTTTTKRKDKSNCAKPTTY